MNSHAHFHSLSSGILQVAEHTAITLLAVGIAFSLPMAAQYILYTWWPKVEYDSHLMLITEIGLAALLVLLFNISKIAWSGRRNQRMNMIASLVHAHENGGALSRRSQRKLRRKFFSARDVSIISITGYDTFSSENSMFHELLEDSYEVRVMLMNPDSPGAARRVNSLGDPPALLESYRRETQASIAYLKKLAATGKKITLKLYDDPPFWKLVVTGEYVWVQYCHAGQEIKNQPEYIFALQQGKPARGFFAPFYMCFLNHWNDPRHPEYNLATGALVSPYPHPSLPPGRGKGGELFPRQDGLH